MNDSTNRPRVLLRALGLIAFVAISFLTVMHIGLAIGANHTKDALVLLFAFMLLASSRLAYFGLLLPLSLLLGAYYPVAMAFGMPSYQAVSALLATDAREAKEFLELLPVSSVVIGALIPVGGYVAYRLADAFRFRIHRNKFLVIFFALYTVVVTDPWGFGDKLRRATLEATNERADILHLATQNTWPDASTSPTFDDYDDYVLVIGESARKDYFAAFGYPVANTPFLSATPGTLVDGLIAAGPNTTTSLRLMLTNSVGGQPNYGQTVVGLAQKAGAEVHWISNVSMNGEFATPVTAIAMKADHRVFLRSGLTNNHSLYDDAMLPLLQELLGRPHAGKRLIILHTVGSHPNICKKAAFAPERIPLRDKSLREIECYASSVRATDVFLEKVVSALKQSPRRWSMVYFADHGLSHHVQEGRPVLTHAPVGLEHFLVPLLRIRCDDQKHVLLESPKNGRNLLGGLASWMGIRSSALPPYELFDGDPDAFDPHVGKAIRKDAHDPAVDITGR